MRCATPLSPFTPLDQATKVESFKRVSAPNERQSRAVKLSRIWFHLRSSVAVTKLKVKKSLDRTAKLAHRRERSVMEFEKVTTVDSSQSVITL